MDAPRPQRRTKAGRLVSTITREELEGCFHMPSEQACRHLGVGLTILKRVCRRFGIPRWPYNRQGRPHDDGSAESSGLYANGGLNHMHGGYGAPPGGGYGPAGSYGAPPPLYAQQQQYGPPQAYAPPSPPMAAFAQPPQQQQGALDWQAQQQLQAALAALIPQAAPAPVPAPAPNLQHLQLLQTVLGVMQGAPAGLNSPAVQGLLSSLLGSGPPPPPQQQQPQQWGGELMPPPPPQQPMPQPASQAMLASLLQHVSALPAGADAQQARSAAADLMAGLVRRTAAGTPPAAAAQPIGATRHAGSSLDLLAGAAAADGSGATDADALNGTSTAATATAVATATVDDGWGTSDGDQDEEEDEEGVDDFVEPKSGPRAPPGGQPGDEAPIAKRARVDGGLALAAALQGTSPLNMGQLRGLQQLAVAGPPLPAAAQRQAPAAAAVGAAAPPSEAQQLEQQLLAALPDLSQTADLLRRAAEQLQAHLLAQRLLQEHAVPLAVQLPSSCQLLGAHAELAELCTSTLLSLLDGMNPGANRGEALVNGAAVLARKVAEGAAKGATAVPVPMPAVLLPEQAAPKAYQSDLPTHPAAAPATVEAEAVQRPSSAPPLPLAADPTRAQQPAAQQQTA